MSAIDADVLLFWGMFACFIGNTFLNKGMLKKPSPSLSSIQKV